MCGQRRVGERREEITRDESIKGDQPHNDGTGMKKKLPHLPPMLASSMLGVLGLLPVTLRSEITEYIVLLPGEDCISREMGVQAKKGRSVGNKYLWDAHFLICQHVFWKGPCSRRKTRYGMKAKG